MVGAGAARAMALGVRGRAWRVLRALAGAGRWLVRVEPGFDAATLLRALEALSAP